MKVDTSLLKWQTAVIENPCNLCVDIRNDIFVLHTQDFPGQDFIEPPELVRGRTAMISVEAQPDYAITPSGIEILFDQVIEPLGVNQPMENRTDRGLPSGRVTISNGLASK